MNQNQLAAGGRITPGDPRPAAGRARMKAVAAEVAAEAETIVAGLLAGLGREPTMGEKVEAELLASVLIRGKRKRNRGVCDTAERRELGRILQRSVFRSLPVPMPQRETA
jgi:hypothetical protein